MISDFKMFAILESTIAVYVYTMTQGFSPRYIRNRNTHVCSPRICVRVFVAALFIIAPNWKLLKYPSTIEQVNRLSCIRIKQCYTAMKTNGLQLYATVW